MANQPLKPQEEAGENLQNVPVSETTDQTTAEAEISSESEVPEETTETEVKTDSVSSEPISEVETVSTDETPAVATEALVDEKVEETSPEAISNQEPIQSVASEVSVETPITAEPIGVGHVEATEMATYETLAEELESAVVEDVDYSEYTKKDCVELAERVLTSVKLETATMSDMKNADTVLKEIKPIFDELKRSEKTAAKLKYIEENGSEEGFEFQNDNYTVRFEAISSQIRDAKSGFFKNVEKDRENSLVVKTKLLQDLRELVANEEISPDKNSWTKFKKIQEDWKNAGSVGASMNQSLWAAYNALVDRYFSNRNIYNELMDLDRKKNQQQKLELCDRMEALAAQLDENSLTNYLIKEANVLFEEYKHVGPAPRDQNEKLWVRFKASLDKLYAVKREQDQGFDKLREEVLNVKLAMVSAAEALGAFNSDSIQAWNGKTKELQELQAQWDAVKGGMPRDKGRDVSKQFWAALKKFFNSKSEFFKQLENGRVTNLKAKTALCEEIETFNSDENTSVDATNRVIEAQKEWKTIGFVPEKYKDSIYERFKAACDTFFNAKRSSGTSEDKSFDENLTKKLALIEEIEEQAKNNPDISKLPELKASFQAIGFVPKSKVGEVQNRFMAAVNNFVQNSTSIPNSEKQKLMMSAPNRNGGDRGDRGGFSAPSGKGNDLKKKIAKLEDEISLYKNNIEFFARSKNAASLREETDKKIAKVQKEIDDLKNQLKNA